MQNAGKIHLSSRTAGTIRLPVCGGPLLRRLLRLIGRAILELGLLRLKLLLEGGRWVAWGVVSGRIHRWRIVVDIRGWRDMSMKLVRTDEGQRTAHDRFAGRLPIPFELL